MGDYIGTTELQNALSAPTLVELFDDDRDGTADTAPIAQTIQLAEALVNSYLLRAYPGLTLPVTQSPASAMLKQAALMFAIPNSFLRHPEYVRTFGENPRGQSMLEQAHAFMERLCTGKQLLFDVPADTTPSTVGGIVYDQGPKLFVDSTGTYTGGDF